MLIHSIGLRNWDLSYLDKTDEKQCPEHRKHMSSEKWYDYSTVNSITTFSLSLQIQK